MILCDKDLARLYATLFSSTPEEHLDRSLINPASIDIRIGDVIMCERTHPWKEPMGEWYRCEPYAIDEIDETRLGWTISPGEFFLAPTLEHITVPNGLALDLRLKSSIARAGWNHSLAFWVDPGWSGVLTMEIQNISKNVLRLYRHQRFAQIIVHELSGFADKPYAGKYQGAVGVEGHKRDG